MKTPAKWLPETDADPQLVRDVYINKDTKQVLKQALLARARARRFRTEDVIINPHKTRSKGSAV